VTEGRRVVVVGGGITGLAAAHGLVEAGVPALLLEGSRRFGGVIATEHEAGFLLEAGPDSFLARKPWAEALCRRVGLGDELVAAGGGGAFVLSRGRLHPLPEGLTAMVPTRLGPLLRTGLLSPRAKLRAALEPLVPRGGLAARRRSGADPGDESLASFFRRRLGDEASRRLVEPLARGIYGGRAESLSLRATFPRLGEIERERRSLVLGLLREPRTGGAAFLSLRRGMGSLVERLLERVPPELRRAPAPVAAVRPAAGGGWEVALAAGGSVPATAVVLAVPPRPAAAIVEPAHRELASALRSIAAAGSLTVQLGYRRDRVRHALRGTGFVVPADERSPLVACTWASSKLPARAPAGSVLLRAFLDPASARDDDTAVELALDALRPLLGLEGAPALRRVHRWPAAIPRYEVGHLRRVAEIDRLLGAAPGLFAAGAAFRGVGVPDCIREGERAAAAAAAFVTRAGAPGSPSTAAADDAGRAVPDGPPAAAPVP
jgi:oxygen-dependent protoporphyrinogen oxidase